MSTSTGAAGVQPKWVNQKQNLSTLNAEEYEERVIKMGAILMKDLTSWKSLPIRRSTLAAITFSSIKEKVRNVCFPVNVKCPELDLSHKVAIFEGDITKLASDSIVNAANESLLGGGGIDGAIHRAAGPLLLEECRTLGGCGTGEAKITSGYDLPAKNVIHTVGPRGEYPDKLKAAYENSLKLMLKHNLKHIAFPCISTGVFGYPGEKAAKVALTTVREFLVEHHEKVDKIIFCLFLEKDVKIYYQNLELFFPKEN